MEEPVEIVDSAWSGGPIGAPEEGDDFHVIEHAPSPIGEIDVVQIQSGRLGTGRRIAA